MRVHARQVGGDRGAVAAHVGAHGEVLLHGEIGKDTAALGAVRDPRAEHLGRVAALDLGAVEDDASGARPQQPRDRAQCGRLAGAVGAEQADELALLHLEIQSPQRLDGTVARAQSLKPEHRTIPDRRG